MLGKGVSADRCLSREAPSLPIGTVDEDPVHSKARVDGHLHAPMAVVADRVLPHMPGAHPSESVLGW